MKKLFFLLPFLAAALLQSCQKQLESTEAPEVVAASAKPVSNTFYGAQVQLGDGHMRSLVRISPEGVPEELGIEFTEGVMQHLPEYVDLVLPLHHKAQEVTPYDHISIGWMPTGHPPANVFTVPHFDIHFYMLPLEEQETIPPLSTATASKYGAPPAGVLPVDYTVPSAAVPMMGRHWLDKFASVLPPVNAPFTHEFIYGTYDGKVIFLEPMVTRAFLLSGTEVHKAIKQPTMYSPTGTYYPTRYNIYTDAKKDRIYVSLDGFVWR